MIEILVMRHGKTSWNLQKKLQGRRDIELCDAGIDILKPRKVPERFSSFDWYSSPLKRAVQTAQLVGAQNLIIEDRLIEMDWGDWEEHTIAELRAKYGASMKENEARGLNLLPPNGESPQQVVNRIRPFLATLSKSSVMVTHKGVIRAMQSMAYDWDMKNDLDVSFDWNKAHLFDVNEAGDLSPKEINIELELR